MRPAFLPVLALLFVAACDLLTAPGATRPLPATLVSGVDAGVGTGTTFTAAGDSVVARGIVPPVCGTYHAEAKIVRGVVVATVVLAPNPIMACALVAGNIPVAVIVHQVPSGSHDVTLGYEYAGSSHPRVTLGWSVVQVP